MGQPELSEFSRKEIAQFRLTRFTDAFYPGSMMMSDALG
jgi:hypothetical protein